MTTTRTIEGRARFRDLALAHAVTMTANIVLTPLVVGFLTLVVLAVGSAVVSEAVTATRAVTTATIAIALA